MTVCTLLGDMLEVSPSLGNPRTDSVTVQMSNIEDMKMEGIRMVIQGHQGHMGCKMGTPLCRRLQLLVQHVTERLR